MLLSDVKMSSSTQNASLFVEWGKFISWKLEMFESTTGSSGRQINNIRSHRYFCHYQE